MPGVFGIVRREPSSGLETMFERLCGPAADLKKVQRERLVDSDGHWALGRLHHHFLHPGPQLHADTPVQVLFHGTLQNEATLRAEVAHEPAPDGHNAAGIIRRLYERHGCTVAARLEGAHCTAILDSDLGTPRLSMIAWDRTRCTSQSATDVSYLGRK